MIAPPPWWPPFISLSVEIGAPDLPPRGEPIPLIVGRIIPTPLLVVGWVMVWGEIVLWWVIPTVRIITLFAHNAFLDLGRWFAPKSVKTPRFR